MIIELVFLYISLLNFYSLNKKIKIRISFINLYLKYNRKQQYNIIWQLQRENRIAELSLYPLSCLEPVYQSFRNASRANRRLFMIMWKYDSVIPCIGFAWIIAIYISYLYASVLNNIRRRNYYLLRTSDLPIVWSQDIW